jgi:hypothetical protein
MDFKKAYDSVRREVLCMYNLLIKFGVPLKLAKLIKISLKETNSKICVGEPFSHNFQSKMVFNKEMLYHHCYSTLL